MKWWCLVIISMLMLAACESSATPTPTPGSMTMDSSSMGHNMEPISDKGAQPATQERGR